MRETTSRCVFQSDHRLPVGARVVGAFIMPCGGCFFCTRVSQVTAAFWSLDYSFTCPCRRCSCFLPSAIDVLRRTIVIGFKFAGPRVLACGKPCCNPAQRVESIPFGQKSIFSEQPVSSNSGIMGKQLSNAPLFQPLQISASAKLPSIGGLSCVQGHDLRLICTTASPY
jgi:hypothetical protein